MLFMKRLVPLRAFAISLSIVLIPMMAGCTSEPSLTAEQAKLRDQFLSAQAIEGQIQTPTDIKETSELPPDQLPPDEPVVIAGRIDAGDFDAFAKGEATFVMSQLPDKGHSVDDPDHADNCPFCKRKLQNAPKVLVRFRDAEGVLIPVSAERLFGLAKDDVVVVKGDATYDSAVGTIMVNAMKMHRR